MPDGFSVNAHRAATKRGTHKANLPSALIDVALDERNRSLALYFRSGVSLVVPISAIDEVAKTPISRLRDVRPSPLGDGLLFREAGEGIYVPGLLRGLFDDAYRAALGKAGGSSKSVAKAKAARANGTKGGRPRKRAA